MQMLLAVGFVVGTKINAAKPIAPTIAPIITLLLNFKIEYKANATGGRTYAPLVPENNIELKHKNNVIPIRILVRTENGPDNNPIHINPLTTIL